MKVSAIVPAYNEEKHIGRVLQILTHCPYINDVICVNDGSTDTTLSVIKTIPNVTIIDLRTNRGKAYAITSGIAKAKEDIVLFIDADLIGLTNETIASLITPLAKEGFDVAIGYKSERKDFLFKPLAGERAYFKRDIQSLSNLMKYKGYGLELYLNYAMQKKRTKIVALTGVTHVLKYNKQSYFFATKGLMKEFRDILIEIFTHKNPISFFLYAYISPFYIKLQPKS